MSKSQPPSPRVFALQAYGNRDHIYYTVVVPEGVQLQEVSAAWAYTVRYTAKGLDLPDHDAAIQLLQKRHPKWQVIATGVHTVSVDLNQADKDIPENA
jgi:hypothetical protein